MRVSYLCSYFTLAPAWGLIQNWNNSPDYIFHWVFQFSLPILFLIILVWSICQGHQRFGGAAGFVTGMLNVSWLGVLSALQLGALNVLWLGVLDVLWLGALLIPCLFLLHFTVPIFLVFFLILAVGTMWSPRAFLCNLFGITITWGIVATWGRASVFSVGAGVGVGEWGIGQSFPVSNRYVFQWWRGWKHEWKDFLGSFCLVWNFSEFPCC